MKLFWYSSIKCNNVNFPTISHQENTQLNKWSKTFPFASISWNFRMLSSFGPATKYEFLLWVGSHGWQLWLWFMCGSISILATYHYNTIIGDWMVAAGAATNTTTLNTTKINIMKIPILSTPFMIRTVSFQSPVHIIENRSPGIHFYFPCEHAVDKNLE